jgi:hypothetical protein
MLALVLAWSACLPTTPVGSSLIPSPARPAGSLATTYYVRPDDGSPTQCTGLVDAPYPGSGGFDSVTRADITPAYRGVNRRNHVEQVTITDTVGIMAGTWTVRVTAHDLPNGNAHGYSLADSRRGAWRGGIAQVG